MASILLALRKAGGNLRFYLRTQLASLPALWIGSRLWGIWSPWYAGIYVAATLPILWGIARICWAVLRGREYRLRAAAIGSFLAIILGRLAYVGLQRHVTYFDWINIALGVSLVWAGTLVGFAAPHVKRWDLALILGFLWVLQAVSSFGWTQHLNERLNWMIDPSLGIMAFLILAWRLRSCDAN